MSSADRRQAEILELLYMHEKCNVNDFVERFGVSRRTITSAGHGFLVRGTSFDHCSGNTLKDRIGLRSMLDAVENGRIEAVMVRDLEQISRNSYILVGVIEILRQNDVYLITTECDLNAELINSGLERFVGDRFTRASFGKPRFDVRLPLMDQF